MKSAAYEISALWVVAACGIRFFSINKVAGMLFIPYQVWVTLATALTAGRAQLTTNQTRITIVNLLRPDNQDLRAAQVNIEIDDVIVSKESKALSKEVHKFLYFDKPWIPSIRWKRCKDIEGPGGVVGVPGDHTD